ncbi:palmitoyltransferase for Vac8p, partial [Spiromyces aspiralis]
MALWSYLYCVFRKPGSPLDILGGEGQQRGKSYAPLSNRDEHDDVEAAEMRHIGSPAHVMVGEDEFEVVVPDEMGIGSEHDPATSTAAVDERRAGAFECLLVKEDGSQRYCKECCVPKPDRSHHCSSCNKCVLRMDHHCPWINNCVGHRNHKAFILFLLWSMIYVIFTCATSISKLIHVFTTDDLDAFSFNLLFMVITSGVFSLTLVMFTSYHVYLVSVNLTTLESLKGFTYRNPDPSGPAVIKEESTNIFDVGFRQNWREVFGTTWYMWFVPLTEIHSDGTQFPYNASKYYSLFSNSQ